MQSSTLQWRTTVSIMPLQPLHIEGGHFVDAYGRQVILRGVNLGGDSKVPFPDGGTQYPSDFANHREVSFVGRPFPLAEAEEHLARIRHWGFNCLRLITTWEAVEHAGPDQYDVAYLDYFEAVCRKAGEHGLYVFIDFHQDVWSRMSGGDGAPGWTFEAVGLDFRKFEPAGAAHVMQHRFDYTKASNLQDSYPPMSWSSNYRMPVNGIMWTLFWGGATITPDFQIDGINVQAYLQSHLLGAMNAVAVRVKTMPHVIGFDTLNEPGIGWLGQGLSPLIKDGIVQSPSPALPGLVWSVLDGLAVAAGLTIVLPVLTRDRVTGVLDTSARQTVNPLGLSIWREGASCPFAQAGIYRIEGSQAVSLREDAMQTHHDEPLDIAEHAFAPFFAAVADTIRKHRSDWLVFAEIDPFGAFSGRQFPKEMPTACVNASHWYDIGMLLTKSFSSSLSVDLLTGETARGADAIRSLYTRQLARIKNMAQRFGASAAPTLLGEFGIPYDLDHGKAYWLWRQGQTDSSIWGDHTTALGLMYDALDMLQMSSTQWNYTAGNRNDLRVRDQWNQEDLSIYSVDQIDESVGHDSGGRAVRGFCRPYVRAVQGQLESVQWLQDKRVFVVKYIADLNIQAPTEIYLPRIQFDDGYSVELTGSSARKDSDSEQQILRIFANQPGQIDIAVRATTRQRNT